MSSVTPLRPGDPRRIGRYRLDGRLSPNPRSAPAFVAGSADGPRVILQLLDRRPVSDSAASDRFTAEARAAARVVPCCVAPICDFGVESGLPYVVTSYPAGLTLRAEVAAHGPVTGPALIALALGTAAGLAAIHQAGLVHGGFGPDHVLLTDDGPQVTGYGVTPPYGAATPAADIQAWAMIMLFAVAGGGLAVAAASWPGSGLARRLGRAGQSALSALPADVRVLVADGLCADPTGRPSADAILAELLGDAQPAGGLLAAAARRARHGGLGSGRRTEDRQARQARQSRIRRQPAGQGPGPFGHGHGHGKGQSQGHGPIGPAPSAGRQRSAAIARPRRWPAAAVGASLAIAAAVAVLGSDLADPNLFRSGRPHTVASLAVPASPGSGQRAPGGSARSQAASLALLGPAALDGTWSGRVRQASPVAGFSVRLTMHRSAGTIYYRGTDFSCVGIVTVTKSTSRAVTLAQVIVRGRDTCLGGVVILTPGPAGTAWFEFRGRAGLAASGWLSRR